MPTTIAIAGISSKLAQLITKSFLQQPDVHVRGSSRDIRKLPDHLKSNSSIALVQSDPYDRETLRSLVRGCDVVICCYLTWDDLMLKGQKLLIDLCEEERVPRYIASDYTFDFRKLERGDMGVKDFTVDVAAYVDQKTNVKGVHILVGALMETFFDVLGVWHPEANEVRYWGTGNEKWDLTSYQTTAEYVATLALDLNASGYFKFRGDHTSAMEIARDAETVTGSKLTLKCNGSLTDIEKQLDGAGNFANSVLATHFFMLTGKLALGNDIDNAKYPSVQPETLSEVLRRRSGNGGAEFSATYPFKTT